MPSLNDLPDELLLQILSYTVPSNLKARIDFPTHIRRTGLLSKRLLRLTRDSFFHAFVHTLDITCLYTVMSPRCMYTQVHVDGVLVAKTTFLEQVRSVNVRLHVYYAESMDTAVEEIRGVLKRYPRLRELRVGVHTVNWKVAEGLEGRIGTVVEEECVKKGDGRDVERRVECFLQTDLMGERISGKFVGAS